MESQWRVYTNNGLRAYACIYKALNKTLHYANSADGRICTHSLCVYTQTCHVYPLVFFIPLISAFSQSR